MLTLVVFAPNGAERWPLTSRPLIVGSSDEADVRVAGAGVAGRHLVLRRRGAESSVHFEAMAGQRVQFNGRECTQGRLELLDELRIGDYCLVVDDPSEARLKVGAEGHGDGESAPERRAPSAGRFLERISELTAWVAADSSSAISAESLFVGLLREFGGGAVFLFEGQLSAKSGVRFTVSSGEGWTDRAEDVLRVLVDEVHPDRRHSFGDHQTTLGGTPVRLLYRLLDSLERQYCVATVVPWTDLGSWNPAFGFAAAADLLVLGLVHHVGRYEPILPGRSPERKLVLAPGLVLGPSESSARLTAQMSGVDDRSSILLQGPSGSGRELVARSLHLSGDRREGPFVLVDCRQPSAKLLLADLVGAEIEGRHGPVRREGKLQSAAGGTLYLDGVGSLPAEVQQVLVSVLRSGIVEGPGLLERQELDVRLISSTSVSLDELSDRAEFRRDLLVRLAQLRLDVPGLHERREDLPLLIQTMVNRFSHDVGKRVRGITVRALSQISGHHFEGNLRELENVVRHMVYLAEPESPMDVSCLPEHLRTASSSDLVGSASGTALRSESLTALLARVERSAIREALRDSQGNKAQAARRLGISRSALARRIQRLQS